LLISLVAAVSLAKDGVKRVFSECGTVQRVILQEKPSSGPSPNSSDAARESLFTPPAPNIVSVSWMLGVLMLLQSLSVGITGCNKTWQLIKYFLLVVTS